MNPSPQPSQTAPTPAARTKGDKKRRAFIVLGVIAAVIAGGFVVTRVLSWSNAYCSRFSYTVSWAWSPQGSAEKKRMLCESAGCKAVLSDTHDDPNAFDDEYSTYSCVSR